uniref:Uncharacterized protein n=1 Tax=viral metagenome TaxID=1070528 RepID=A0A6C0JIY1_9ZZZZ
MLTKHEKRNGCDFFFWTFLKCPFSKKTSLSFVKNPFYSDMQQISNFLKNRDCIFFCNFQRQSI